jgi:dethiobiotin synthetase
VAAARGGVALDMAPVMEAWRRLRAAHDVMLVEGIGGILCPVTPKASAADLAKWLGLPVLIIARAGLGTINHTALTVEAARARKLEIAGIVVNRYDRDSEDVAQMTGPDEIQRVTGVPVLALIPEDRGTKSAEAVVGEDVLAAVQQMQLERLLI